MSRPKLKRKISFKPEVQAFLPSLDKGFTKDTEEVILELEELEVMRLVDKKGLTQTEAAEEMNTSQSTVQRILAKARHKVAKAIVQGKVVLIEI